jgi:hypothetical protein
MVNDMANPMVNHTSAYPTILSSVTFIISQFAILTLSA